MLNTYKYGIHEGVGGVEANGIAGHALVVAHILPLDVSDHQLARGQHLEPVSWHNLLVLIVEPGHLGPGHSMGLAGQQDAGAHQVQMRLLRVGDARLLGTRVRLLGHVPRGAGRMHHSAGKDGLGARASHAGVGAGLAQRMVDDVHRTHADNGAGCILGQLVGVQVFELREGEITGKSEGFGGYVGF